VTLIARFQRRRNGHATRLWSQAIADDFLTDRSGFKSHPHFSPPSNLVGKHQVHLHRLTGFNRVRNDKEYARPGNIPRQTLSLVRFTSGITPGDAHWQLHMISGIDPALSAANFHGVEKVAMRKGDGQPFVGAPGVGEFLLGKSYERIDVRIVAIRVVVEKDQILNITFFRNTNSFKP
jgi:hypothetical protein